MNSRGLDWVSSPHSHKFIFYGAFAAVFFFFTVVLFVCCVCHCSRSIVVAVSMRREILMHKENMKSYDFSWLGCQWRRAFASAQYNIANSIYSGGTHTHMVHGPTAIHINMKTDVTANDFSIFVCIFHFTQYFSRSLGYAFWNGKHFTLKWNASTSND